MSVTEWRPLETAPKDGTPVLVFREDAGVFTAHYAAAVDFVKDGDCEPQWWTIDGQDLMADLPTHWMPLPEPPK
jgi:hypothetical protein